MNKKNVDFETLKTNLKYRLFYIMFVDLFNPTIYEGPLDDYIGNMKLSFGLIEKLSEENYDQYFPIISGPMEAQIKDYQKFCIPKKPIEEIGKFYYDNEEIFFSEEGKFNGAIEFKHIKDFFNSKNFLPQGLPDHALIGIKDNASAFFIEENFVLDDAFYFLGSAEKLVEFYSNKFGDSEVKWKNQDTQNIKNNICSNSRAAIQIFNNFVECFLNSIGYDYFSRNKDSLTSEQESILLKGKRPHRNYLSLKRKIVKVLDIVCSDESLKLRWNRDYPMSEPYTSFFEFTRQLRILLVHPGPVRQGMFQSPAEWYKKALGCGKICMEVSQDLWTRCYPEREFPEYLGFLDFDKNLKNAYKRVEI
ncbi:MAG: hypothetical protein GF311_18910 [Candidatus Lokiarchaeota archaeon]|nr:hypothetical protein [Candidatus Lokiarchaeota archaeon]